MQPTFKPHPLSLVAITLCAIGMTIPAISNSPLNQALAALGEIAVAIEAARALTSILFGERHVSHH